MGMSFASVAGFPEQEARWLYDTTSGMNGGKNIKSSEPQASNQILKARSDSFSLTAELG